MMYIQEIITFMNFDDLAVVHSWGNVHSDSPARVDKVGQVLSVINLSWDNVN